MFSRCRETFREEACVNSCPSYSCHFVFSWFGQDFVFVEGARVHGDQLLIQAALFRRSLSMTRCRNYVISFVCTTLVD